MMGQGCVQQGGKAYLCLPVSSLLAVTAGPLLD